MVILEDIDTVLICTRTFWNIYDPNITGCIGMHCREKLLLIGDMKYVERMLLALAPGVKIIDFHHDAFLEWISGGLYHEVVNDIDLNSTGSGFSNRTIGIAYIPTWQ